MTEGKQADFVDRLAWALCVTIAATFLIGWLLGVLESRGMLPTLMPEQGLNIVPYLLMSGILGVLAGIMSFTRRPPRWWV